MRLDPEHVEKLRAAMSLGDNGERCLDLDIPHLTASMQRLSLWEGGLLIDALMRAAASRKLTREQRVLLALFVHDKSREEVRHAG